MINNLNKIKDKNMTFLALNIYLILLVLIPKSFSTILNIIPTRLFITCLFLLVVFVEKKWKMFTLKNNFIKFFTLIYALFILFTIPSIFVSKAFITSVYTLIKFVLVYFVFLACTNIKLTEQEKKTLLTNLIIITLIITTLGLFQYIFEINLFIPGIEKYPGAKGRISVTFYNTIYLGIYLNLMWSLFFYKYIKENDKLKMILYYIIILLIFITLILTFTRSSFLIFFGILFVLLVLLFKEIKKLRVLGLILAFILTIITIPGASNLALESVNNGTELFGKIIEKISPKLYQGYIEFIDSFEKTNQKNEDNKSENNQTSKPENNQTSKPENNQTSKPENKPSYNGDWSLIHREEFANTGIKVGNEHKLTGVGFGAYLEYLLSDDFDKSNVSSLTHPHSALILLYAEVGLLATLCFIVLFILIILYFAYNIVKNYKQKNNGYYINVLSLAISLGFMVVNIISENAIYDTQVFPIFMIITGIIISLNTDGKNITKNGKKKVLFIASTGGHLNELMQLEPMFNKYDYHIITEKDKSTINLKNKYCNKINYLVYGTKDHKFKYIFKFTYNIIKSFILYIKIRPKVIVTTGTHTAVPICYIGKLFGSKIVFIETFANRTTKTLSGKILYPIANLFIVQWAEMLKLYPKAKLGGWIY